MRRSTRRCPVVASCTRPAASRCSAGRLAGLRRSRLCCLARQSRFHCGTAAAASPLSGEGARPRCIPLLCPCLCLHLPATTEPLATAASGRDRARRRLGCCVCATRAAAAAAGATMTAVLVVSDMEKRVAEEARQDQAPRSPSRVVLTITILAHRLITNPATPPHHHQPPPPSPPSTPLAPSPPSAPPCHHFLCPSHFQPSSAAGKLNVSSPQKVSRWHLEAGMKAAVAWLESVPGMCSAVTTATLRHKVAAGR